MTEATAGLFGTVSRLLGRKEKGPSEESLKISAYNHYIDRLASLSDSPLRGDAQGIKNRVQDLLVQFEARKKTNPNLSEKSFLDEKSNGKSHTSFTSAGWSTDDPQLKSFNSQPITKDHNWNLDRVVEDALGETKPVNIDTRFVKSDSLFFPSESMSYDAKRDNSGIDTENGHFSQWFAGVTNEDEKAGGISIALKREDEAKLSPNVYLTGHEGGVRAYSINIDNATLASVIHSNVVTNI